jgi:hypothetical protein
MVVVNVKLLAVRPSLSSRTVAGSAQCLGTWVKLVNKTSSRWGQVTDGGTGEIHGRYDATNDTVSYPKSKHSFPKLALTHSGCGALNLIVIGLFL